MLRTHLELHEPNSAREAVKRVCRYLKSDSRLACSAGAQDRDKVAPVQQELYVQQLLVSPNEPGCLLRKVIRNQVEGSKSRKLLDKVRGA